MTPGALCLNPGCAIYSAHLPDCAGGCRGCQPRPATIGNLCRACCNGLGRDAVAAARVHAELADDLTAGSTSSGTTGGGGRDQRAIAVGIDLNKWVFKQRTDIANELTTWVRLVHEETGIPLPQRDRIIMPLPRGVHGPANMVELPSLVTDPNMAILGAWLKHHRQAIAELPAAGEICAALCSLVHNGEKKQERIYTVTLELGQCPRCPGTIKAVVRRDNPIPSDVTCTGEQRHRWSGERRIAELGREVGARDGWLSGRDIARRYDRPLGTVRHWASVHRWRRTQDGQRPVLYHPEDVEATVAAIDEVESAQVVANQSAAKVRNAADEATRLAVATRKFWQKVDRSGTCWNWTGAKVTGGYGQLRWLGLPQMAHRVAYQLMVGEIPPGHQIDHVCGNTACVNPKHLQPVTPRQNGVLARLRSRTNRLDKLDDRQPS